MVYLFKGMYSLSRTRNKTDLAFQKCIMSSKGKKHIFEGFEIGTKHLNKYIFETATTPLDLYLNSTRLLSRYNTMINFSIGGVTDNKLIINFKLI